MKILKKCDDFCKNIQTYFQNDSAIFFFAKPVTYYCWQSYANS